MQTNLSAHYEGLTKKGEKRDFINKVRERTQVTYFGVERWVKDYNRTVNPDHLKALSEVSGIEINKLFEPVAS